MKHSTHRRAFARLFILNQGLMQTAPLSCRTLIDRRHKVIMDWSPKAGSSIVVAMFFEHMGILPAALEYDPWVHKYREDFFYKDHYVTRDDLDDPDYIRFKVVRNPYTRAVSSYIQTMRCRYAEKRIKKTLCSETIFVSFDAFIRFLETVDITKCNSHYREQTHPFEDARFNGFHAILKLENVNSEIKAFNSRYGFGFKPLYMYPKNKTPIIQPTENAAFKPWTEIAKSIPHYRAFYTPELIERVGAIYHRDILNYNYTFDLGPLLQVTGKKKGVTPVLESLNSI